MDRDKATDKTINLLLGDTNPNADFYCSMFQDSYCMDLEMTPISPMGMSSVTRNNNIILTSEVYKKILEIRKKSLKSNSDISFFLTGSQKTTNVILLDNISFEEADMQESSVICISSTHSKTNAGDNFILKDLISYIKFDGEHSDKKALSLVVPESGDFNFMVYDKNPIFEGLYTYPIVYLKHDDGKLELLPAYENGNYILNNQMYGYYVKA